MAETVEAPPTLPSIPTPKRRKLTQTDLEAVADKVIRSKLTETEACRVLDINVNQWWVFKARKGKTPQFDSLCSRIRGATIENAMQTIEDCGNGIGMKQPDWRAHAFRLQVIAPERFATNQGQNQQQTGSAAMTAIGGEAGLLKLVAMYAGKAIADQPQVKNLPSVYTEPAIDVPCVSSVEASQTDYSI